MVTQTTVSTDAQDYAPGSWAEITATGFDAGSTVTFQVQHTSGAGADGIWGTLDDVTVDLGGDGHEAWSVTDGSSLDLDGAVNGAVTTSWYVNPDDSLDWSFLLTAMASGQQTASAGFTDSAGSYTLKWYAADPAVARAPYIPTYVKVTPAEYLGGGFVYPTGRTDLPVTNPLDNAVAYGPTFSTNNLDAVTSLAPKDMALGQIVPFEMEIKVTGSTAPEGGVITFTTDWLAKTTSGGNFGFDTRYKVVAAFVDTGDVGTIDPGANAKVDSFSSVIVGAGTSNERIQGTFQISGLNTGDNVIVEMWVVLDDTIPAGVTGNVQTSLVSAKTGPVSGTGSAISTGNQTVPLLKVQDFFSANADISVVKSDSPDAISNASHLTSTNDVDPANLKPGDTFTYTILAKNNSTTTVSNGVIVTDTLDPNLSFVGATDGGTFSDNGSAADTVTWNLISLSPGESKLLQVTVMVKDTAPTSSAQDLLNSVSITSITADSNAANNTNTEATDLISTVKSLTIEKVVDQAEISAPGTLHYLITVTNTGNMALTNVMLTDDLTTDENFVGGDTDGDHMLDVGEAWVYSASYQVTQQDMNLGGDLVNTAIVDTDQTDPMQDSATTTIIQSPSLEIDKVVDKGAVSATRPLTYTITVKNTGNVDLTDVVLTDEFAGGATLVSGDGNDDGVLQTNEVWIYKAVYQVTQADLNKGTALVNVATVYTHQTGAQHDSATTTIIQSPSLEIDKVVDKEVVSGKDMLTYTITVTNTGNVDLTGVVLTDEFADGAILVSGDGNGDGVLQTHEVWVYKADYQVTQADLNKGTDLVNTATVDTDQTNLMQDSATTIITQSPSLEIDKVVDQTETSTLGTLQYLITVKNTGNVDLTGVVLTDEFADGATLVSGDGNGDGVLQTSEVWIYKADYQVTQADLNKGTALVNTATVDTDQTDLMQDSATTTIIQSPLLEIDKVVDKETVSTTGMLTYTIKVTNTGNVDLTGVVLKDAFTGGATLVSGDGNNDGVLQTNEIWIYKTVYQVTQSDLNKGADLVNTASVDTDQTDPVQDSVMTTIIQVPSLEIDKVVDKEMVSGTDVLTYTITVKNTGNVSLTNVTLTDEFAGGATLVSGDGNNDGVLQTNEVWTYSAGYQVTQADLNRGGNLVNTAIVDTDQTNPMQDSATTSIIQAPSLEIDKVVDSTAVSAVRPLVYTITVKNTGNVDLTDVVLTDEFTYGATLVSGDGNGDGVLQTTEVWIYKTDYLVTQADLNSGADLVNVATIYTKQTGFRHDSATTSIIQTPSLEINKVVDKEAVSTTGMLTYTITVKNTGNVDLTHVTLTDEFAGGATLVSGDANNDSVLQTNEVWVYTADYQVTQQDINLGDDLVNTAIVDTDQTAPMQDSATTTISQSASLMIEKLVDQAEIGMLGTLHYLITVFNTGNVALTNVMLTDALTQDEKFVAGDTDGNHILDVGEVWIYSASYQVTQQDINLGSDLVNTAIVDTDQTDPMQDSATTFITRAPSLEINKVVDKEAVSTPGMLTYTITVTNTGNVDLTHVTLTDEFADGATLVSGDGNNDGVLQTTETWIYTADYQVTQTDLNRGGNLINMAIVDTDQTNPMQDSATTSIVQAPSLEIDKVVDRDLVSATRPLTYTITVKNTGNVDLTHVTLTDEFAGGAALVSGDGNNDGVLQTNEVWIYKAIYQVTQADLNKGADLVNTAIVDTDQTDPMQDSATTKIIQAPSLEIDKVVDKETVSATGTLTYTITVTNTGNVDLTHVTLTDEFAGGATLVSGDGNHDGVLQTNEVWTYSADYLVTQADLNRGGDLVNTATVDTDQTSPMQDSATTTITQSPSLEIDKVVDKATVSTTALLTYTITVKNTGNVDLTGVVLTDTFAGGATLVSGDGNGDSVLQTNEVWVYKATYQVTQTDLNKGTALVNTATVDTDQTNLMQDSATTTITYIPSKTGLIAPTNTTIQQYIDGTAQTFQSFYGTGGLDNGVIQYSTKTGGAISQTNPGVFFYFTGLSGLIKYDQNSDLVNNQMSVTINQTSSLGSTFNFAAVKNGVQLYKVTDANGNGAIDAFDTLVTMSTKNYKVTETVDKIVITFAASSSDLIANTTSAPDVWYLASVKYNTASVVGKVPSTPTVHYAYDTQFGGVTETYTAGVDLAKKPGAAMHLAGDEGNGARAVTDPQIKHVTDAAITWWDAHADLSDEQVAMLREVDVRIQDLGYDDLDDENGTGWMLGLASADGITIDDDAAGHGWSLGLGGVSQHKVDLFSVLVHEMGHMLGKSDEDMGATLAVGERKFPDMSAPVAGGDGDDAIDMPDADHPLGLVGSAIAEHQLGMHMS